MPRVFRRTNGTWTEIKSIFRKTSGSWTEILTVFRRDSGTWVKVFSAAKIPGNTVAPTITGTGKLFGTLTNNSLGTWTNSPTSYTRQWRRGNPPAGGGEPTSYSNISGATSSTYTTTSDDNGKYIVCVVTATNALGSNTAVSNAIYVNKFSPEATGNYTISGSAIVGGTLTALESISPATWKQTTTNSGDTYPDSFEYEWSYENGTEIQSLAFNQTNSSSYLVKQADLGNKIRLRVKGVNTGGDAYTSYILTATVTSSYQFSFGNILHVGSNAYIGLDSFASTANTLPTGRSISIHAKDMVQYRLAEYSDSSDYWLYYRSYLYNQPQTAANALDYQIRFYTDTSRKYCDIYFVRKGSNVVLPTFDTGFWNSGVFGGIFPSPPAISTGTVVRVYFDGQQAIYQGVGWTLISDNIWKDISTASIDDSYISVTTGPNRQASVPVNTSLPTLSTNTGNFSSGSTITVNAGSWNNANSFTYELIFGTSTPLPADSSATKTLVNTNQYVITDSDASNPSYYFRGRVTGHSGSAQTGLSAVALSSTSSRSNINPTTTISVGTATENGFTISGTAGPLNGAGSTFANLTSIQIFNSSQSLISTITTGLPTVNGTTGAWSYVWTGGSASTSYYAKATVTALDTAQTTFTTAFSSLITTLVAFSSPTISSVSYNTSNQTWTVNHSGGSGPFYQIWYQPISSNSVPSLTGSETSTADGTGSSSTSTSRVLAPSDGFAYYWWVRSAKTLNATGVGNVTAWNGPVTMTPINTAAPTLTGTTKVGQTLTYGIGTWINRTSQDLRLYRGTANVNTSETLAASSTSTSASYVIPSSDFTDPNNRKYYKAFASASNASFTSGFVGGTELGPLTNIVLYTITFDSLGGTSVSSLTQSTEGGSISKPTDPTKTGVVFGGWSTTNGGTTAVSWPRTPSSNETLYAIWTTNYTLSYNGNGNTGGSTASTTGNGNVTVATNGFTRTNCTFSGWNTSADGTGTAYAAGSTFNLTANTTLYARWAAVANSATAPTGFKFDGNNLPTSGRKRWSWTGVGTVTGGTATGIRVQMSSTSSTSGFSTQTTLATSARSWDVAVSPVTSPRWVRIAMVYNDGLGVSQVGTNTAAL